MPDTATPARVVDAPLASPAASSGLLEVFRRRYLLKLLVRREISSRYQGSFFGLAWSYIQPAIRFAMYWFVLGEVVGFNDRVENFGIHLFAGMVLVHYFTETFNGGTRSILANKALVRKMAMPKEMFPVASMLVSLYHTVPGLGILVAACLAIGWRPDWVGVGAMALGFAIVATLGTALALLFSAANVFFRDFGKVIMTLTQFTNFSVPMLYPYTRIVDRFGTGWVHDIYMANPVVEAVLLMQRLFWAPTTDDVEQTYRTHFPDDLWARGFIQLGACVVFLVFSQWAFSRLENKIPERI
jgi:ABC-2 type transport system permease protein